jgi:dipeptidase
MRSLPGVYLLSLFFGAVGAFAQPGADPPSAVLPYAQLPNTAPALGTPSEEEIRSKSAYWHAECISDWDRQTHMSKKEWADTCQRVVDDRVKWLRSRDHLEDLYGP